MQQYVCPICVAIQGSESNDTWIKQADIFYSDEVVLGIVSSKFIEGNEGHALVVPREHVQNLYTMSPDLGRAVFDLTRRVALAMKTIRKCDGITLIQNNEPAGDQHVFHYHMHVIPRFTGDHFHEQLWNAERSEDSDRIPYAHALKQALE